MFFISLFQLEFDQSSRVLILRNDTGEIILKGALGTELPYRRPFDCSHKIDRFVIPCEK